MKKLAFLSLMLLNFGVDLFSQNSTKSTQNSISRIDSLTVKLFENTNCKLPQNLTFDEIISLDQEKFSQYMSVFGSTIKYEYNDYVKTQISYMINPNSSFLRRAFSKKDVYFNIFEEVLDKKNMPIEIKYLSIVESLLDPNAVSWCGATGLWQFMPATGRMMDLQITSEIDERKDIYKSTEKACDYLQSMYNMFGDWLLALAAYNGGPGNVNKAIRLSGGKRTFWEVKRFLPKETQNYVPKFIATAFTMNYYSPAQFEKDKIDASKLLVQVDFCCPVEIGHINAMVCSDNNYEFNEWNSNYKSGQIPENIQCKTITLSYYNAMRLIELQDSIIQINKNLFKPENYIKHETYFEYHKVRKGETWKSIANKFGISILELKKYNKVKNPKAGQTMKIAKHKTTTIPVNTSFEYQFYVTKNFQSYNQLFGMFSQIDKEKTLFENKITNDNDPIPPYKLLKIYFVQQL